MEFSYLLLPNTINEGVNIDETLWDVRSNYCSHNCYNNSDYLIKVGWKYFSVKQYNGLSKVSNIVSIHLVIFSSDELVLFVKECFSTCINSSIIWKGIKE